MNDDGDFSTDVIEGIFCKTVVWLRDIAVQDDEFARVTKSVNELDRQMLRDKVPETAIRSQ